MYIWEVVLIDDDAETSEEVWRMNNQRNVPALRGGRAASKYLL